MHRIRPFLSQTLGVGCPRSSFSNPSECAGGYCDAKQVGKSEFRVLKPKIKPAPLQQKMFYRARGHNNADLVDQLKQNGVVSSGRVESVMLQVDRGKYAREPEYAYNDHPSGIGDGQTISAPHMHAMCMELLEEKLKPGARALDVGSGSGYLVSCFGLMVGKTGRVVGIENFKSLVDASIKNIKSDRPELFEEGIAKVVHGDGWKGYPDLAPFDAIHVGAAAASLPEALTDQLAPGGRLVIPVGGEYEDQYLMVYDKDNDGRITSRRACGVRYVPLVKGLRSED